MNKLLNFGANHRSLFYGANLQPFRAATYIITVFLVFKKIMKIFDQSEKIRSIQALHCHCE